MKNKKRSNAEPRSLSDILDKLAKAQDALDALDNRDEKWAHRIGILRDQINDMAEEIKDRSSELLNPDFTAAEMLKRQAWERMVEAAKGTKPAKRKAPEPCRYCGEVDCTNPTDCPQRRRNNEEDARLGL